MPYMKISVLMDWRIVECRALTTIRTNWEPAKHMSRLISKRTAMRYPPGMFSKPVEVLHECSTQGARAYSLYVCCSKHSESLRNWSQRPVALRPGIQWQWFLIFSRTWSFQIARLSVISGYLSYSCVVAVERWEKCFIGTDLIGFGNTGGDA